MGQHRLYTVQRQTTLIFQQVLISAVTFKNLSAVKFYNYLIERMETKTYPIDKPICWKFLLTSVTLCWLLPACVGGITTNKYEVECSEDDIQRNCHCRTSLQLLKYNQLLLYNSKTVLIEIMSRDLCINTLLILNNDFVMCSVGKHWLW